MLHWFSGVWSDVLKAPAGDPRTNGDYATDYCSIGFQPVSEPNVATPLEPRVGFVAIGILQELAESVSMLELF
jgi:hypothetical protein